MPELPAQINGTFNRSLHNTRSVYKLLLDQIMYVSAVGQASALRSRSPRALRLEVVGGLVGR